MRAQHPDRTWGAIETVAFYDNVSDRADLSRRVRQAASTAARVGKRVAMGLKVEGLSPFDGYDICDNIPVEIVRGVIDTRRYGSGWWTIHGVEWRIFPDGHTELTLAVLPKEDRGKPRSDLLVDQEVLPDPVPAVVGEGSITTYHLADGAVKSDDIESVSAEKLTGDIEVRPLGRTAPACASSPSTATAT